MKKITNIFAVLSVIFIIWITISFIDINAHNSPFCPDYHQYADWNFFSIVFGVE